MRVALQCVECARRASTAGADRRVEHVGYYLVGPGRNAFEARLARRRTWGRLTHRFVLRHATGVYLCPIALLTTFLVAAALWYARSANSSMKQLVWVALLTAIPLSQLAVSAVQYVLAGLLAPRRLPRLDLDAGIPEPGRTMVIVPTLFGSVAAVEEMLAHLEVQALGNLDPRIHFAVLSDFLDADERQLPEDHAILHAARAGVQALNDRHAHGRADRFYLFHRERRWNGGEGRWMGWERKRGKLEEFNRILRGATDTSFTDVVGDLTVLPSVNYCITLDSDTRLPRDAAKTLIGVALHPLNQPIVDPVRRVVTEGYGILQPRVSVTMASAAGSVFARVYAGHTGVDPYTTAVSDTYQDLFGEGIFTGKGLYHVDAFKNTLEGRIPENALLSHDLFARRPRERRRGGRRLPGDGARSCAPAATVGAWRLADSVVAVPVCADQSRPRAQPAVAHQSLEDPGQSASQSGRAVPCRLAGERMDGVPRSAPGVDHRGARRRRRSTRVSPDENARRVVAEAVRGLHPPALG